MKANFRSAIAEALRLTRTGSVEEATRRIQDALGGGYAPPPKPMRSAPGVIDVTAERVTVRSDDAPSRASEAEAGRARGTFEERSYRGAGGTLRYRLYRPAAATTNLPLVVMLHGCTQSPEDFAAGTGMNALADELGLLVVYPAQPQSANPQKCWNWFRPEDQRRDRGEPAMIAGITREVIASEGADASRVYVAGLSAGGAAAAIMASAYPDLYAAVGIHSGLACGAARDLPSAMMAMRNGGTEAPRRRGTRFVPVITFHGDRDTTVNEANSRQIIAAASAAAGGPVTTRVEKGRSAGGQAYSRAITSGADGRGLIEQWTLHGAGHAWSGGSQNGSYTDPAGPDASREMLRFFLAQKLG